MIGFYNIIGLLIGVVFRKKTFDIGKPECMWQIIGHLSFLLPGMYIYYISNMASSKDFQGILVSTITTVIAFIIMIKSPNKAKNIDENILDDEWIDEEEA